ncbi:hypothetical protein RI367_000988 [Sorochytrium milnesiophthora]
MTEDYSEVVSPRVVAIEFRGDYSTFSPFERVVLSSNGSLQRILSAYHNRPIHVELVMNDVTDKPPAFVKSVLPSDRDGAKGGGDSGKSAAEPTAIDREVRLLCDGRLLCIARSYLRITNPAYLDLLHTQAVGLGQFFRHVNVLPRFELLEAAKTGSGDEQELYRLYTLSCAGVECYIAETFPRWSF